MERLTASVVLALGGLVVLATVTGIAQGQWETTPVQAAVLLLVVVGMWRAGGHLRA